MRSELPPSLRAAMDAPPVPPKAWQDGVGPAFVSLWISVVFLDRLAQGTLLVGGLGPSLVGAVLAGLLGYWGLYYAPAIWGAQTRRPLSVVASSTFGAWGSRWIPGVLLGVISIVWFAITIDYATQWSLSGLAALDMLDPKQLETAHRGASFQPRPLFLFVAAVWSLTSAVIGILAVRLVAAIMLVYPIFAAIALGLALLWAIPTAGLGPIAARPFEGGGWRAIATMAQLMFGFLAANALASADWGAASNSPRDARLGGLVGVMLAGPIVATVGLLIVAGALGRPLDASDPGPAVGAVTGPPTIASARAALARTPADAPPVTLREVFLRPIGGRIGGTGLLVLSLALLGPACFNPFVIARQFSAIWPAVPRLAWTIAGALLTWPLILTGLARRTELLFGLIGAAAAPVAGAMAADYALRKGRWPGPRRGVNLAGMIAWAVGLGVGLVPYVGFPQVQPASMLSFVAAFVVYAILAMVRLEPPAMAAEVTEPAPPEVAEQAE